MYETELEKQLGEKANIWRYEERNKQRSLDSEISLVRRSPKTLGPGLGLRIGDMVMAERAISLVKSGSNKLGIGLDLHMNDITNDKFIKVVDRFEDEQFQIKEDFVSLPFGDLRDYRVFNDGRRTKGGRDGRRTGGTRRPA